MDTKLTTVIEQVGIIDGKWKNAPHNQTAVREPQTIDQHKGDLFVVAEVQGQLSNLPLVEKRLAALVRDTYYPANGGITAGLRRAIQAANQWLYQHNVTTKGQKAVIGGVVAAVMKDNDLFVAQVGPSAVYVNLNGLVSRYPQASTWLDPVNAPQGNHTPALGLYHLIEPKIAHLQIEPGDSLILTDARLAQHLPVTQASQAMQNSKPGLISQKLTGLIQAQNGSALIIEIARQNQKAQPIPAQAIAEPSPATPVEKGVFNLSLPSILQKPIAPRRKFTPPPADDENESEQEGFIQSLIGNPAQIGKTLAENVLGAIAFLGKGLQTILRLVLPGSQAEDEPAIRQAGTQARPAAQKTPSNALKYVAIGLPVVVIIITLLMYWYKGYSRENEYVAAFELATEKYNQAQIADPQTARTLIGEAELHLTEASTIKAGQTEVTTLQSQLDEQLDEVNGVHRLHYMPKLREYTDAGNHLDKIILEGAHVYVLDTGLNRVYHHTLDDIGDTLLPDPESPILIQQGEQIDDVPVNGLLDIMWMAAGGGRQTSDLLVLKQDGTLEYDPNWGVVNTTLAGMDQWQTPVSVGSYYGNFYVLDTQANQIYRYLPTANGYEYPPEGYFAADAGVNLSGAIDMAIDGAIYVLYQDGRISKFLSGQPTVFQIAGLDKPFNNPVALYTAPDELIQYLYVVDAGNQRIVKLTKDGQFVAQFKPRSSDAAAFDDLRAVYVDEISEKMFILNGSSLYAPNIPEQTLQSVTSPEDSEVAE